VTLASIRKVKMGLGWNAGCDVDGSCVMMDANKRTVETVSYSQLSSNDNTVKHSGDDRTGEGGEFDCESARCLTSYWPYAENILAVRQPIGFTPFTT
jgi:stress response protein SCP2